MIEMYLAGVSTRRIEDVSEALWGASISTAPVSNLNEKAFESVEAWIAVFLSKIACYNVRSWKQIR